MLAGVEEAADAVVPQVHESELDPLDALRQVVDRFGRAVCDLRAMPRDDRVGRAGDRAAETADFERHLAIGEVTTDRGGPLGSEPVLRRPIEPGQFDSRDFVAVLRIAGLSG